MSETFTLCIVIVYMPLLIKISACVSLHTYIHPYLWYCRFDEALLTCHCNAKLHGAVLTSTEAKAIWTAVLKEMRGRLYEHCATVLIIHGLEASHDLRVILHFQYMNLLCSIEWLGHLLESTFLLAVLQA